MAGFVEYQLAKDLIVFTHTEVDPACEGQGVGSALARAALDEAPEELARARALGRSTLGPSLCGPDSGATKAEGVYGANRSRGDRVASLPRQVRTIVLCELSNC